MKKSVIITCVTAVLAVGVICGFMFKKPGKIDSFQDSVTSVENIAIPEGTRIVALGEATHGNKEFQELKLEVFQELVEDTNVRALILEGDMGGCALANNYIQGGEGSAEEVTKLLGYRLYRTDQMRNLVQWMHDYNETAAEDDKVRLYGMDIQNDINAINYIKDTYSKLDEEKCKTYSEKLDSLLGTESDAYDPADFDNINSFMDEISKDIEDNKDVYVETIGKDQVETLDRATYCIKSYLDYYEKQGASNKSRDTKMKENVDWALSIEENDHNGALMMACHNGHMTRNQSTMYTFLGKFLSDEYGDEYFAIGTDYYNTEVNLPGQDGRINVNFCSNDKLAYQVKDMEEDKCYINFDDVDDNSKLGKIINNKMKTGSVGEDYNFMYKILSSATHVNYAPTDMYDAMILYYETNPTVIWED
ncbi:MAG: erythromycin esterase family protein [Eubacterium sp.]|nr:erythromycin esterase family protein [Eubacterium sp.]